VGKSHIGDNIKFLRSKYSLTQEEFGALFGATRDNIASYERGSEPRLDFIARMAAHFGLTSDLLIGTRLADAAEGGDIPYGFPTVFSQVGEPLAGYQAGESSGQRQIPIYDRDASAALSAFFADPRAFRPVDHLSSSTLPRCDGGIRVDGEGMAPIIRPGDIVFYRRVNDIHNAIVWGEVYLLSFELDGDEYTLIRYIHSSDRPGYIRLSGYTPRHTTHEIALSQIRALALVKGNIRIM
jgi:transcriptional regulator with XRE-family HTH domain